MKTERPTDTLVLPGLLAEVQAAAEEEHRAPGELVREAIERYMDEREWKKLLGYGRERALAPAEFAALPLLARGAALRFLLTRLFDWLNQPAGALVRPKDPREYLRKLHFHRGITSPTGYGLDA